MRSRAKLSFVAALFLLVAGTLYAPTARAMPQLPTASGSPRIQSKVMLGDTSIASPALWTNNPAQGASPVSPASVLAWTGTDAAHHLNVMTSGDGLSYGNKRVLSETSPTTPAVAVTNTGAVAVAWIGTDVNHSLNVLVNVYSASPQKLILWSDNSFAGPALAYRNGVLLLAWAGTDANHMLNVLPISLSGGLRAGQKVILTAARSLSSPSLTVDPHDNKLLMSWALVSPANRIQFATSTDGVGWQIPLSTPIAEWTGAAPSMMGVATGGLPGHFLAWTGTDTAHSLNVQYTQSFPQWPQDDAKGIQSDTVFGGPVLGRIGSGGSMLIAWTGTDVAHHLNAATVSVTLASACVPTPGVQPVSSISIYTGSTSGNRVSLTFDSDGGSPGNATTYLNILESNQVRATFFVTGQFANANPAIVKRIVGDSDDIGNHTMDHLDLANPPRTDTFICTELVSAGTAIANAAGRSPRPYFRPPYGSYNSQVASLAAGLGYRTILWSIDPRDWDPATTTQDILNRVLNSPNLKPGAIILMHVNSPNEQYALQGVITGLKQKGFTIVPLSELLS